jgi:hypothetical protein
MHSIDLIRDNLKKSVEWVLGRVEDMEKAATVCPTPRGGCHTLWLLGHLAYIEHLVIDEMMRGEANPLADWKEFFDGDEPDDDPSSYPLFADVLATCRQAREETLLLLDSLNEDDLDQVSARVPAGWESTFATYRLCFQYAADHWYMHRGQFADARRAAGIDRIGP